MINKYFKNKKYVLSKKKSSTTIFNSSFLAALGIQSKIEERPTTQKRINRLLIFIFSLRFLNAIVNPNYVIRPQDYTTAFNGAVTGNEGNTQIVFQYIQNNLAAVTTA